MEIDRINIEDIVKNISLEDAELLIKGLNKKLITEKGKVDEEDDGSLAYLKLGRDEDSDFLVGNIVTQSKIVNTTFWIFDYVKGIQTKYTKSKEDSEGQTLVQIRPDKESPESDSQKFFTGSKEIIHVLDEIKKLNAFPRKVTLRREGNKYYLE